MDAKKSSNLETTHQPTNVPSTSSQPDFNGTHDHEVVIIGKASILVAGEASGSCRAEERRSTSPPPPAAVQHPETSGKTRVVMEEEQEEEGVREKLKRHRVEMSGRVWIPEIWGQENLLKNWIDCTVFDSSLDKSSIMSAREALIQDGTSSSPLRLEHSC